MDVTLSIIAEKAMFSMLVTFCNFLISYHMQDNQLISHLISIADNYIYNVYEGLQ